MPAVVVLENDNNREIEVLGENPVPVPLGTP
jgi:hypothetical protein